MGKHDALQVGQASRPVQRRHAEITCRDDKPAPHATDDRQRRSHNNS